MKWRVLTTVFVAFVGASDYCRAGELAHNDSNETDRVSQIDQWVQNRVDRGGSDVIFSNGFEFGCQDLAFGLPLQQSFSPGLARVFCLEVAEGDLVRLRMVRDTSSIEPLLELRDSAGDLIASNSGAPGATIEQDFLNAGVYSVTATDLGRDSGGGFALSATRLNPPSNATALEFGVSADGSLGRAQFDAYSFAASVDDVVRIRLAEQVSSPEPQLELFDAAGNLLAINAGGSAAEIEFVVPEAGTYYILASDEDQNEVGGYSVSVNRLNAPPATPLTYGLPVEGVWDRADFDAYSFAASVDDVVRIRLAEQVSSPEPQLELFDAAGNLLAINAGGSAAEIEFVVPEAGTYYILASDEDQNDVGGYTIEATLL